MSSRWSSGGTCSASSFPGKLLPINSGLKGKSVPLMTYKIGNISFLRYYFKILVKESNAYLQLIPAGGRLFCTGWTRSTKSLLQIMHADCMTYWKATEARLGTYFTVALYCCFSMLMQLWWSAKNSNPASELLILQRCFCRANQSLERWWV